MNDTETFELCKEVYKKTQWWDTFKLTHMFTSENDYIEPWPYVSTSWDNYPLYTSDYLLEKLPAYCSVNKEASGYVALYIDKLRGMERAPIFDADTPLKALLKLVIALDDAGVKL